jgi:hypothetical protein
MVRMAEKRVQPGTAGSLGRVGAVTASVRHYLTSQHLWSALHNARRCAELEFRYTGKEPFHIEHRTSAITTVLEAVAFLEALVNEVFQDATDTAEDAANQRIAALGKQCIGLMAQFWEASKEGERYVSVLDKYQMALLFANKARLPTDANPYQHAKRLIDLRNTLVHFRPVSQTHGEKGKLEKDLAGKFKPNALTTGVGYHWFPDRCLGAGCTVWACTTSRNLADEWTGRLGIPRSYDADLANYPAP